MCVPCLDPRRTLCQNINTKYVKYLAAGHTGFQWNLTITFLINQLIKPATKKWVEWWRIQGQIQGPKFCVTAFQSLDCSRSPPKSILLNISCLCCCCSFLLTFLFLPADSSRARGGEKMTKHLGTSPFINKPGLLNTTKRD